MVYFFFDVLSHHRKYACNNYIMLNIFSVITTVGFFVVLRTMQGDDLYIVSPSTKYVVLVVVAPE
jgi:hypothetical protein